MKNLILVLAVLGFTATSCVDEDAFTGSTDLSNNKEVVNMNVPAGFDWKTTEMVELAISGIPGNMDYRSTLTVSDEKGTVLFKGLYQLNTNIVLKMEVSAETKKLKFVYGRTDKTLDIVNKKASYSFVTLVTE